MNIESILRKVPMFKFLELDLILFESQYPVLFTCRDGKDVYLFSCCFVNAEMMKWIASKTNYETLIQLLSDKITIRDAFLNVSDEKLIVEYDGESIRYNSIHKGNVPTELLPSEGEFMDVEENEFAEEIAIFEKRNSTLAVRFTLPMFKLYTFSYEKKSVCISDDVFSIDYSEGKGVGKTLKRTFALG